MDEALSWACVGLIYVGLAAAAVLLLQARGVSSRFDRAHLLNRMCFLCFPKVGFQRKKKSLLEINVFPGVLTNWAVFLARWPQDFPVGVRLPFFLSFWGFNGFPFFQSTNQKRVPLTVNQPKKGAGVLVCPWESTGLRSKSPPKSNGR